MKAFIALLLAVLCVSCVFAEQCAKDTCVVSGQSCNDTDTNNYHCTSSHTYCNSTTLVCIGEQTLNQACNEPNLPCGDHLVCGKDNTCVTDNKAKGADCGVSGECNSELCENGKCVEKAVGETCMGYDENCAGGDATWCKQNTDGTMTCQNTIANGAACDLTQSSHGQCHVVYVCTSGSAETSSVTDGTCQLPFLKASGAYCSDDQECGDGLACVNSSTTALGVCAHVAASSGKLCNLTDFLNNPCDQYETCFCNGIQGTETCQNRYTNNPSGIAASAQAFAKCVSDNCQTITDDCLSKKCLKVGCVYANQGIQVSRDSYFYRNKPKCLIDSVFGNIEECKDADSSSASISAVASTAAVVAAALSTLVF